MTDSNYTHLGVVVDRSGSMGNIQEDMRGALTEFFAEQAKLPGVCKVYYAQFDDRYEVLYEDLDVSDAVAVLEPRGMTALNDAFGKTIVGFGEKLASLDEDKRPGKVIVVVVTDGGENASREWTVEQVKAAVEKQTNDFDWEFVFLGANMDAVKTGGSYGVATASSITYDVRNTGATMDSLSAYVGTTRSGGKASFSDEDRKNAVSKS